MNEKTIWDKLTAAGMTAAGAAAVMGNLYAESALLPTNLQNTYEKKLGFTDESYTKAVDSGSYKNFIHDAAGYGLAQWTYWTRKQAMLGFARERCRSIGDLDMQLDFLLHELQTGYAGLWKALCSAENVRTASDLFMVQFENPADKSEAAKAKRAAFGERFFGLYAVDTAKPASDQPKPMSELVQEILRGEWGNGDERKAKLTAAGYDYKIVQAAVNAAVRKRSGRIHTVAVGDTLTKIARAYGTSVSAIVAANADAYPAITADFICVGWRLKV